MFTVGLWYFVKAPYRGGNGMKGFMLCEPVFQVIEVNEGGSATKIRYVSGMFEHGQKHNQGVIVSAHDRKFMQQFTPSSNTRFQVGGKYRAIHSGIIDCLKMRGGGSGSFPNYTALCNLIKGTGYKNGAVLEIVRAFYEVAPKVRAVITNNGYKSIWTFDNKPINLPDYMAAFFELVSANYPAPSDAPAVDHVLDAALSAVDKEPELEFGEVTPAEPEETEDQKLLKAIKYLLSTRDVFTGKRLRLGYLSETYSRDDIKTPSDIIDLSEKRREEIQKYIEQQQKEIRNAEESIKKLSEL